MGLEISRLTFAYDNQPDPVLRDLSLKIEPGEMVALQGVSGAGKTTLLDLLTGLLQPNNGAILADRQPLITEADRRAWRAQVAYLPQDPFLFDDTIRSNLAWSAPDVQEDAVWDALDMASASEFVRATPEGLDTRAGDRGQKFSGGERQRLCIARALLRRPRLLILDEATSALDRQTEEGIMERLKDRRADLSVLLITHREESLRHADRVYRLENGSCTHV